MSETRNIFRNAMTDREHEQGTVRGGPGREDSGLAAEVARWGAVANAHSERQGRSGRDAQMELNLRRNRSGQ